MKRIILGLAFVLGLVAFAPQPAAAEDCALSYARCLSDTWYLTGLLRMLADIECGADYVGCIRGKVLGL